VLVESFTRIGNYIFKTGRFFMPPIPTTFWFCFTPQENEPQRPIMARRFSTACPAPPGKPVQPAGQPCAPTQSLPCREGTTVRSSGPTRRKVTAAVKGTAVRAERASVKPCRRITARDVHVTESTAFGRWESVGRPFEPWQAPKQARLRQSVEYRVFLAKPSISIGRMIPKSPSNFIPM